MKSNLFSTTALVIGIVILINLLAYEYHVRLDLTEDKQYTLSKATRDILENLEEPVTVKAYFSKDLPPNITRTREDFQDLLIEYANLSDDQVVYEFINPNEKESYEQEAIENGIRPVLINVREKDQVKQQKAFLGATLHLGEKEEVIPFLQPGASMEYALSTAIKKISIDEKPVVGFITGHGEPSLSEMTQASGQLSVLYETREISLADTTSIPENISTLALIRPTDSIPDQHLAQLDAFLERGGSLLVALNSVDADFRNQFGSAQNNNVKPWLKKKGIEVLDNFIVDAQCGSVSVPQQLGIFTVQANISFPFVPVISTFSDHAITSGLETVMLEFASEVRFTGDSSKTFYPLAFSSEQSNDLPAPQFFDINKEWTENDFTRQNIPVAAAVEGNPMKMVVIADGDFPVNGPPQQSRTLQPDNVSFLSNAIDWLSDDTGLIALRTKGVVSRPIREVDETTKNILKYTNFLLPILLVIGYGIIRAHNNRITRLKRMSENYEQSYETHQ
jgi:gliding-associated putative ABC transporter substrate-binding component GldG